MAGEISHEDVTKIIEIANKSASGELKLPEPDRQNLMKALAKLKGTFQSPVEATIELASGDMRDTIVKTAIDLGLFNIFAAGGGKPQTTADLATATKAAPRLIARILRFLSSIGVLVRLDKETWAPTPTVFAWTDGSPLRDILVHFNEIGAVTANLPFHLKARKYQEPDDYFDGPFTDTFKKPYWDYLVANPELHSCFNRFMVKTRLDTQEEWFDFFPTEKLAEGDESRPLLIDIGCGLAHDTVNFKKHNDAKLHAKGAIIAQDLPTVIAEAKEKATKDKEYEGLELMPYSFFDKQPVTNGRNYYLRTVLHDWPDKSALQILANVKAAMPSDARLLINENIISDEGDAPLFAVWMDTIMMVCFSAWERNKTQWLKLFDDAGFDLVKLWEPKQVTVGGGFVFELKHKETSLPSR